MKFKNWFNEQNMLNKHKINEAYQDNYVLWTRAGKELAKISKEQAKKYTQNEEEHDNLPAKIYLTKELIYEQTQIINVFEDKTVAALQKTLNNTTKDFSKTEIQELHKELTRRYAILSTHYRRLEELAAMLNILLRLKAQNP
tara:strand:+ start:19 stop:444 length:426 start_codon:yes stop_codon:yes gene_type:complete